MEDKTLYLLVLMNIVAIATGYPWLTKCSGPHCVQYSAYFADCKMYTKPVTADCRWKSSFDTRLDETILHGKIAAYQIQWFNGEWSVWFVPGLNDIDWKFNPTDVDCELPIQANSLRRVWAYFYDHRHRYILCNRPPTTPPSTTTTPDHTTTSPPYTTPNPTTTPAPTTTNKPNPTKPSPS